MNRNSDVTDYVDGAPEGIRPALVELRKWIRKALPRARETMDHFPVYTIDDEWISGFAYRKKGPMFYCMQSSLLDKFDDRLGKLRSGRGCVEYRGSKAMTFEDVRKTVQEILDQLSRRFG